MLELDKSNFGGVLFQNKQIKDKFFTIWRCQKNAFRLVEKEIIFTAPCLNMRWARLLRNA